MRFLKLVWIVGGMAWVGIMGLGWAGDVFCFCFCFFWMGTYCIVVILCYIGVWNYGGNLGILRSLICLVYELLCSCTETSIAVPQ